MTYCDKSVLSPQCDNQKCEKCYPKTYEEKVLEDGRAVLVP